MKCWLADLLEPFAGELNTEWTCLEK